MPASSRTEKISELHHFLGILHIESQRDFLFLKRLQKVLPGVERVAVRAHGGPPDSVSPEGAEELGKIGLPRIHGGESFHEFVTACPKTEAVLRALDENGILGGLPVEGDILWCATELVSRQELDRAVSIVKEVL